MLTMIHRALLCVLGALSCSFAVLVGCTASIPPKTGRCPQPSKPWLEPAFQLEDVEMNLGEILDTELPDDNGHDWIVKLLEHHGDHVCLEVVPSPRPPWGYDSYLFQITWEHGWSEIFAIYVPGTETEWSLLATGGAS